MRGLFGPASTKEASNKPAENRDRGLKFNSDTIVCDESESGLYIFAEHQVFEIFLINFFFKSQIMR